MTAEFLQNILKSLTNNQNQQIIVEPKAEFLNYRTKCAINAMDN